MSVSHKTLSSWYLQLAQSLHAGMTLGQSLETCGGPQASDRMAMSAALQSGASVDDMLRAAPKWLPRADRVFLAAAAQSGRLPQTLVNLGEHHARVGATQLKVVLGLLYPLGMFHFAALILPIMGIIDYQTGIQWDTSAYLLQVFGLLLPIWVIIIAVVLLAKSDSPLLPAILRCVPVLRSYAQAQSLADFSYALGTFIDAGVPIRRAWQGAAAVSRDKGLRRAAEAVDAILAGEGDPTPELRRQKVFPADFCAFYETGARSGQLEQNLLYQSQANNRMTFASVLYPTLLFVLVAGFVIYSILHMYAGYLENLTGMMD